MKKIIFCTLLLGLFLFSTSTAFSKMYYSGEKQSKTKFNSFYESYYNSGEYQSYEPKCNKKKTYCEIGEQKMRSSAGLFVLGNIVCNHKRTVCTDGNIIKRSSTPQY